MTGLIVENRYVNKLTKLTLKGRSHYAPMRAYKREYARVRFNRTVAGELEPPGIDGCVS